MCLSLFSSVPYCFDVISNTHFVMNLTITSIKKCYKLFPNITFTRPIHWNSALVWKSLAIATTFVVKSIQIVSDFTVSRGSDYNLKVTTVILYSIVGFLKMVSHQWDSCYWDKHHPILNKMYRPSSHTQFIQFQDCLRTPLCRNIQT